MKTNLSDIEIKTIKELSGECVYKKDICKCFHIGFKRLNKIWLK